MSAALPPLMYVTHRRLMGNGPELVDTLRAALWQLPPESIMVYVREPDLEGLALVELCRAFVPIVRESSQRIVVRERVDVARYVGADGVQLPEDSFSVAEVRRLWPGALCGVSLHDPERLGGETEADFATLSPIHPSETHPTTAPLGLEALRRAVERSRIPIYALGGIDADNAEATFATGVHGVAMMRAAWRPVAPSP